MIKAVLTRLTLAAALVVSVPATVIAQADGADPEGTEWHLTRYAADGASMPVPWQVDATLLLSGGMATGSSSCNTFNGSYQLSLDSLTIDDAFALTQRACVEPDASVETGYMANLPLVSGWSIEDDGLQLSDADGAIILEFEQAVGVLTLSDIAELAALFQAQATDLERLEQRLDSVRIGTLRSRINELESEVKQLRVSLAAQSSGNSSGGGGGPSAYSSAEKVLLKGIPANIRSTCSPLRVASVPAGTVASVQCQPTSSPVAEMAYYLMEYPDALATMRGVMSANNVKRGFNCYTGKTGWTGPFPLTPFKAEGCFVRNGKANLRVMDTAALCHRLNVAGAQMKKPTIYAAIEGKNKRIAPLSRWAITPTEDTYTPYDIIRTIPFGNQPDDGCP
jgi:heat shock protein HslJ